VVLQYIPTDQQVIDILTKHPAKGKFEMSKERLGVVENTFLAKEY